MNPHRIALVMGWILLVSAGLMLLPVLISLFYRNGDTLAISMSVWITAAAGGALALASHGRGRGEVNLREAFAIVVLAWVGVALFGALPFWFSGEFPSFLDCFFESMSGITTTGASILAAPAELTHGIAFWRCFMQWIGGLGIVLFGLTILPLVGVGGMHLFRAGSTGPSSEKITPRLKDTAKILWRIYLGLTLAETALLMLSGLGPFEALCHSFTTMATGGFSTRNESAGAFGPLAQVVITLFMFLAGVNFALYHQFMARGHKSLRDILRDQELRLYFGLAGSAILGIWLTLMLQQGRAPGGALLASAFQVGSVMTATGFASENFDLWPPVTHSVLILLIMVGGMAGSTAGGIKVVRVRILVETVRSALRKQVTPGLVSVVRFNGRGVPDALLIGIGSFIAIYVMCALGGTLVLTLQGATLEEAFSASVTCLSNTGPGLARLGPASHFGWLGSFSKLTLVFLMLVGRLEFYTVLALFEQALLETIGPA